MTRNPLGKRTLPSLKLNPKKKKNNCYENIDAETIECGYDECFFSDVDIKP